MNEASYNKLQGILKAKLLRSRIPTAKKNKRMTIIVASIFIVAIAGCQANKTKVAEGSVIGGLLGATAGGIIGHQSGHGGGGAAIGAAAGILGGALVGSQMPKQGTAAQTQTSSAPAATAANQNQLGLQQIAEYAKQGVNENVIIDKIRLTNSRYRLTADDIAYLRQQGVSQKVIDAMQAQ